MLGVHRLGHGRVGLLMFVWPTGDDEEAASVRRVGLGVERNEAVRRQRGRECSERQIDRVTVAHRVVLPLEHQWQQVMELEDEPTTRSNVRRPVV